MKNKVKKLLISFTAIVLCMLCSVTIRSKAESIPRYEYRYIIIEEKGFLNIYKTDNLQSPFHSIKFNSKILPEKDQAELKKGILILDANQLKQAIEDYTG